LAEKNRTEQSAVVKSLSCVSSSVCNRLKQNPSINVPQHTVVNCLTPTNATLTATKYATEYCGISSFYTTFKYTQ